MTTVRQQDQQLPQEDPLVTNSRREAVIALGVWFAAMVYSVGVCYFYGYNRELDQLGYIFGVPDWVFWGIFVPWIGCFVVSSWFSVCVMKDDDLGEDVSDNSGLIENGSQQNA